MAPRSNKKMKSRSSKVPGIQRRGKKFVLEKRLPGNSVEKLWIATDDQESANSISKLVCEYTSGEKTFPLNHPNLPRLNAFRKKEFEAFIWEEFWKEEIAKLLQGFATMLGDDEPDALSTPILLEGGPSHATVPDTPEYVEDTFEDIFEVFPLDFLQSSPGSIAPLGWDDLFDLLALLDTPKYV